MRGADEGRLGALCVGRTLPTRMTEIVASQANIKAGKANAAAAKAAAAKEAVAAAAGGAAAPARAAKAPKAAKKQTAAAANKANKFVTPSAGSRELQLFTQALSAEAVTFSVDVTYKRPSSEQVVLSRPIRHRTLSPLRIPGDMPSKMPKGACCCLQRRTAYPLSSAQHVDSTSPPSTRSSSWLRLRLGAVHTETARSHCFSWRTDRERAWKGGAGSHIGVMSTLASLVPASIPHYNSSLIGCAGAPPHRAPAAASQPRRRSAPQMRRTRRACPDGRRRPASEP